MFLEAAVEGQPPPIQRENDVFSSPWSCTLPSSLSSSSSVSTTSLTLSPSSSPPSPPSSSSPSTSSSLIKMMEVSSDSIAQHEVQEHALIPIVAAVAETTSAPLPSPSTSPSKADAQFAELLAERAEREEQAKLEAHLDRKRDEWALLERRERERKQRELLEDEKEERVEEWTDDAFRRLMKLKFKVPVSDAEIFAQLLIHSSPRTCEVAQDILYEVAEELADQHMNPRLYQQSPPPSPINNNHHRHTVVSNPLSSESSVLKYPYHFDQFAEKAMQKARSHHLQMRLPGRSHGASQLSISVLGPGRPGIGSSSIGSGGGGGGSPSVGGSSRNRKSKSLLRQVLVNGRKDPGQGGRTSPPSTTTRPGYMTGGISTSSSQSRSSSV